MSSIWIVIVPDSKTFQFFFNKTLVLQRLENVQNDEDERTSSSHSNYLKQTNASQDHRYLIEVDCSSGQFKSAKLNDKDYTFNAFSLKKNITKRTRLMHQVFNICWEMVGCQILLLMLYLSLLDICGQD